MSATENLPERLFDRTPLLGGWRRRKAAAALAAVEDDMAVAEPFVRALLEGQDRRVHEQALARLERLTEPAAVDVVCAYWAGTRHPGLAELIERHGWIAEQPLDVRLLGLLAAGRAEELAALGPDELPVLLEVCSDRDARISEGAWWVVSNLGQAATVEALVDMALEEDNLRAYKAILEVGYGTADPARQALLLLLTERFEALDEADPQGVHLAAALRQAALPRRTQAAEIARDAVSLQWARAVGQLPALDVLPAEWDALLVVLGSHRAQEPIWRLSLRASVPTAMAYIRHLVDAGFAPRTPAEAPLFQKLAGLVERCEGDPAALAERVCQRPIFEGQPGQVTMLAVSPDWHYMAIGGDHGGVRVVSLPDAQPVVALEGLPGWTRALAFGAIGRFLAVATLKHQTRVYRLPDGQLAATLATKDVAAIALRGDGRLLAASAGARVDLWDVEHGRVVSSLPNHGWPVERLEFGARGRTLVAWSKDGTTRVWTLPEGQLLSAFDGAEGGRAALALSPDERLLAVSDQGGIVRVYTLPGCELAAEIPSETRLVRSLAFRPDGEVLAVGGFDHCVRIFAMPDGMPLGQLPGYAGASVLSWSRLGQLVTASVEGNRLAHLWHPAVPPMTAEALQRARAEDIAWAQRRHADGTLARDERAWLTAWGTLAMASRGALPRRPAAPAQGQPQA
ncbi:MAG: hypothetical protein VKS61_01850 [Candidatus Sericytochromatia bacterium]|nr:hypothetical protein [Candidatus Sericytochromatia bacterium]